MTQPTSVTQPLRDAFAVIGAAPKVWIIVGALMVDIVGQSFVLDLVANSNLGIAATLAVFETVLIVLVGFMVGLLNKRTPRGVELWTWIGIVVVLSLANYARLMLGHGATLMETQYNDPNGRTPARWTEDTLVILVTMVSYLWGMARLCGVNMAPRRYLGLLSQMPIFVWINVVWWVGFPEVLRLVGEATVAAFPAESQQPLLIWSGLVALIWVFTAALGVVTARAVAIDDADTSHATGNLR